MTDDDHGKLTKEVEEVFANADLLFSENEVESALDKMAVDITAALSGTNPLIICQMIGAVIPVGKLLPRLKFPLQLEYVHASRYKGATSGGHIEWLKKPTINISGRTVLIIDDILDEGFTLSAIIEECRKLEAKKIYTAVLVNKKINKPRFLANADFTGLNVPDRYVFGYGMDYKEYLRNCSGIYAVKES